MNLHDITTFILDQLKHNSFLTGGGALMALGGFAAYFRRLPGDVWRWIKASCILEVEVTDRDPAFVWLAEWLAAQPYSRRRARRLSITTIRKGAMPGQPDDPGRILLTPAPGTHYFRFKGRWLSLHRERQEGVNDKSSSIFGRETLRLSILTRRREVAQEIIEEARRLAEPPEDDRRAIHIYQKYSDWCSPTKRRPRSLDSVVLAKGVMEALTEDITRFRRNEDWYLSRSVPYRRTYLLYGPPGSGKSSAVWAIASHFKMDLAVVHLAAKGMGDDDLRECLATLPEQTIGLIEDIDCVFQERAATDDNDSCITFSGLLNALDGVAASEGRIMFVTTNHREKLDPALLRPGRCDVHFELNNADSSQVLRMFDRFFPEATPAQAFEFVTRIPTGKVSMAAIQGALLQSKDDVSLAIKNAEGLCTS